MARKAYGCLLQEIEGRQRFDTLNWGGGLLSEPAGFETPHAADVQRRYRSIYDAIKIDIGIQACNNIYHLILRL